ncbi:hypothetical protein [Dysosmobacter sp.]
MEKQEIRSYIQKTPVEAGRPPFRAAAQEKSGARWQQILLWFEELSEE